MWADLGAAVYGIAGIGEGKGSEDCTQRDSAGACVTPQHLHLLCHAHPKI